MKELLTGLTNQQIKDKLIRLEKPESLVFSIARNLEQTVYGQEEACRVLARRVAMFEAGLSDPNRPLGVEFFLGPTGTGKTETSHALAKHLFDDPNSSQLKIIDCSEFWDRHTVARLVGAPPSYVGYGDPPLITPGFLNNRNIIVFDEVEKGSTQLHRILLSIMEDGRLRARQRVEYGTVETVLDFSKSVIILTSNIGAAELEKVRRGGGKIGFNASSTPQKLEDIGKEELKKEFKDMPEFVNRIDDVVVFKPLEKQHYEKIFWKFLGELNNDLCQQLKAPPFISASTEFRDYIMSKVDYKFGARDMRHILDQELLERLADYLMANNLNGKPVVATYESGEIEFYTDDAQPFVEMDELTQDEIRERIRRLAERNK